MSWRRYSELLIEALIFLCGISAIVFVFSIFIFVFKEGVGFLADGFSFREFFLSPKWEPEAAGDAPPVTLALIGRSFAVTGTPMLLAGPVRVRGAGYLFGVCSLR